MNKNIKWLSIILCLFSSSIANSQDLMDMEQVIDLAVQNSLITKKAKLELEYGQKEYALLKKRFLPTIQLSSSMPIFSKETTRITIPSGEDVFVNQNQIFNDIGIGLEQVEPFFNGNFRLGSRLSRIDILGDNASTSYFSRPISLNYSNSNFLYNEYKWDKIIIEKEQDLDLVIYNEELGSLTLDAVELFLELYTIQNGIYTQEQYLTQIEEMQKLLEQRLSLGKVSKSEILDLQIEALEIQNDLKSAAFEKQLNQQQLANLIGMEATAYEIDTTTLTFPVLEILPEMALELSNKQNAQVLEYEKNDLQLNKRIAEAKKEGLFNVDLNMSFGLSSTGEKLDQSLSQLVDQQFYSVGLSLNVFDFGKRKARVDLLQHEQKIANLSKEEEDEKHYFNIQSLINKLNNYKEILSLIEEAKGLARENYAGLLKRFKLGNISVDQLNDARDKIISVDRKYFLVLKDYWLTYYELRKETMYDFEKNEPVRFD